MADLAKVQVPISADKRLTDNKETLVPSSVRSTRAPDLEVNAHITRPNNNGADILKQTLGLVDDTMQAAQGLRQQRIIKSDEAAAAQATMDYEAGTPDANKIDHVEAYRKAWSIEGAKTMAQTIDRDATELVNGLFTDPDKPPTLADVNKALDDHFAGQVIDPTTKRPFDLGDPKATRIVANQMLETRGRLLGQATDIIKKETDTKIIGSIAGNVFTEALQQRPIGADPITGLDPSAPPPAAPAAGEPAKAPATEAPRHVAPPTGKLPVQGTITNTFAQHAARGSAGLDIAAPKGTPIQLPATGKVLSVSNDPRSGNFVRVDHGNGVVSSYAHLSSAAVKVGDVVQAGQPVGNVGDTGHATGPHVHYRVKVNGKDVDPQSFRYANSAGQGISASTGAGVQVQSANDTRFQPVEDPDTALPVYPPLINFEQAMGRVPPSVDRGFAKKQMLQTFINLATQHGDARALDPLITSARADGSPSFSPGEISTIQQARQEIKDRAAREADKLQSERHSKNADVLLEGFVSGAPPSAGLIRDWAKKDLIDPQFGYSMLEHMDAEQRRQAAEARQEAREARSEARQARFEAQQERAMELGSIAALRRAGVTKPGDIYEDMDRFRSGALGSGREAASNLRTLQAASAEGGRVLQNNPDAQQWGARLEQLYKPRKGNAGRVAAALGQNGVDMGTFAGMTSFYSDEVGKGVKPYEAYVATIAKYVPKGDPNGDAARTQRLKQLREKSSQGQ